MTAIFCKGCVDRIERSFDPVHGVWVHTYRGPPYDGRSLSCTRQESPPPGTRTPYEKPAIASELCLDARTVEVENEGMRVAPDGDGYQAMLKIIPHYTAVLELARNPLPHPRKPFNVAIRHFPFARRLKDLRNDGENLD